MPHIEIRLEEHLDTSWVDWLEGFTITHTEENQTILTGTVPDQAALYGLIAKLRDLGVKLISVKYGEGDGEGSVHSCLNN